MNTTTHSIATLHHLLAYEARKFSIGEIQLKTKLPDWIRHAGSLPLKTILEKYLHLVEKHINSFGNFFEEEKIDSFSLHNPVMKALIEELDESLALCAEPQVSDACLLACIQAINHYKISMYGSAAAFANSLELPRQAAIFHEAEVNEKQIDDRLSQLALFEVNKNAKSPIVLPESN